MTKKNTFAPPALKKPPFISLDTSSSDSRSTNKPRNLTSNLILKKPPLTEENETTFTSYALSNASIIVEDDFKGKFSRKTCGVFAFLSFTWSTLTLTI